MKKLLIPILIGVLAVCLLIQIQGPNLFLVFASPDSYGNDVTNCEVSQYNGTNWNLVYNFTSFGGSTRINAENETSFLVQLKMNATLAADEAEAETFSAVYMNITYNAGADYIWTNQALNQTGTTTHVGDYYYIFKMGNWTSSLPSAGVTYNCTIDARFYY